jgi:hemoglobin
MTTLFDKYGGFATVSSIVRDFYKEVIASPTLKHHFENIQMDRLIDHQTKFIASVLGSSDLYSGKTMTIAHRNLNISSSEFAEVANILKETLEDAGVEDVDVATIISIVASLKDTIVKSDS